VIVELSNKLEKKKMLASLVLENFAAKFDRVEV
jgi:hypothetical protein